MRAEAIDRRHHDVVRITSVGLRVIEKRLREFLQGHLKELQAVVLAQRRLGGLAGGDVRVIVGAGLFRVRTGLSRHGEPSAPASGRPSPD